MLEPDTRHDAPPPPNPVFAAICAAAAFIALCLILALGLRVAGEVLLHVVAGAWGPA